MRVAISAARSAGADGLVHDERPVGAGHGREHGGHVEGGDGAEVDHLGRHPVLGQRLGRLQRIGDLAAVGDDRDVVAGPLDVGHADRDRVALVGHRAPLHEQRGALHEHAGIVVLDARQQQALGVVGRGRDHHLQAGRVHEDGFERLAVLGADRRATDHRHAHGHRHGRPAARHVAELGGVVGELVEAHADEVHEHDLGHRPHAGHRRTHRRPDDRLLGDGGVADAVLTVLGRQALGDVEHAAAGRVGHVLAHEDDGRDPTPGPRRGPG